MKTETATKRPTLTTQIHYYAFNLQTPSHKEQYAKMLAQINANAPREKFHVICDPKHRIAETGSQTIELETEHIFDNQWNSTTHRVFDWFEEALYINGREQKHICRGHWLTITPEMTALREQTLCCGYCGALYGQGRNPIPANGFCAKCLGSEYLKETELHLLRLVPVARKHENRAKLTQEESAMLLPAWREMRETCDLERASKARKRELENIQNKLAEKRRELEDGNAGAKEEHDGMLWIWQHGFSTENWIYYRHTRTFCLGWREPVSAALKSKWLDVASEFPFNYEVRSVAGNVDRKNEPASK